MKHSLLVLLMVGCGSSAAPGGDLAVVDLSAASADDLSVADLSVVEDDIWICSLEDLGCVRPPDLRPRIDDLTPAPVVEAAFCPKTCSPSCSMGTECVATGTVAAACFKPCHVTDDCEAGLKCVGLDLVGCGVDIGAADAMPRRCLPVDAAPCPGAPPPGGIADGQHCDRTDPNAVGYPFWSSFGCAFVYTRCKACRRSPDGFFAIDCDP